MYSSRRCDMEAWNCQNYLFRKSEIKPNDVEQLRTKFRTHHNIFLISAKTKIN